MKTYMALIIFMMSFSATSRELEFMEYFSIYSDYDVPSINLGMYHPDRFPRDKKKKLEKRKIALKKWRSKKYYGVVKDKLIALEIKSTPVKCYGTEESVRNDINCDIRMLFKKTKEKILFVVTKKVKVKEVILEKSKIGKIDFSYFDTSFENSIEQNTAIRAFTTNWNNLKHYSYDEKFFYKNHNQGFSTSATRVNYETGVIKKKKSLKKKKVKLMGINTNVNILQSMGVYLVFEYTYTNSSSETCIANGKVIELCFDRHFVGPRLNSIIKMNDKEYYVFNYKNYFRANDNDVLLVKKTKDGVVEVKIPGEYIIAITYIGI